MTLPLSYSRLRASRFSRPTPPRHAASTLYRLPYSRTDYAGHSRTHSAQPSVTVSRRPPAAQRQTPRATRPAGPPAPINPREPTGSGGFGGEGRVRTSVATRAADLQSAAIDRSATSPLSRRSLICWSPCFRRVPEDPLRTMNSGAGGRRGSLRWSWRRDLNPRPADYKSAALPD